MGCYEEKYFKRLWVGGFWDSTKISFWERVELNSRNASWGPGTKEGLVSMPGLHYKEGTIHAVFFLYVEQLTQVQTAHGYVSLKFFLFTLKNFLKFVIQSK